MMLTEVPHTHAEKLRARYLSKEAIRKGILTKSSCEICGGVAEIHHDDYEKPLEIRWLCRKHHIEHHKEHDQWGPRPFPKPAKKVFVLCCPTCNMVIPEDLILKEAASINGHKKRPGAKGLVRNPAGRPAKKSDSK